MAQTTKSPVVLELAKEYPPPDEAVHIEQLLAVRRQQVRQGPSGKFLRESHPKHHGCVRAEFIVPELPASLRVGVFAQACTYPAWIRFSNATGLGRDGTYRSDIKRDVRGMAIKLLGVKGEKILEDEKDATTQDFLLITPEALIAPDVATFARLLGKPNPLRLLWFFLNPFDLHLRELGIGIRSLKKHANPLHIFYASVVPYRFGDRAVKYRARPVVAQPDEIPKSPPDDYLRAAMRQQLAATEARFDFMIQVQTDPYTMPIEDATAVWDEDLSPFQKVATIRIPAQHFDTAAQQTFCEDLSFTPWHSLSEHRPLGGINRARKVVYQALSALRHEHNDVPRQEPTEEQP